MIVEKLRLFFYKLFSFSPSIEYHIIQNQTFYFSFKGHINYNLPWSISPSNIAVPRQTKNEITIKIAKIVPRFFLFA